jgi:hypothetical protein
MIFGSINYSHLQMDKLPHGENVVTEPLTGYKYLVKCKERRSLLDLMILRDPVIHERCYTEVVVKKDGKVIRPFGSDDLRTDAYFTKEINTFDGKTCSEALSPVTGHVYKPHTSYTSQLDPDLSIRCTKGLHFYPSMERMADVNRGIPWQYRSDD